MFKKILVLILFVASYSLLVTNCHAQDENITITTYYPSPYGTYRELRSTRMAIGDGYIQGSQYCWPGETCLYSIDEYADLVVEGNVGIGIRDPRAKLHVWGDVRAGDSDNLVVRLSNDGVFVNGSGSAAQPLYSMNVANTGMFQANSGIGFTVTGTERMRIDSTGNVGIGTVNPERQLHLVRNGNAVVQADAYGDITTGPNLILRKARGAIGSPTALQVLDPFFNIQGRGYDGSNWTMDRIGIKGMAAENWSSSAQGAEIRFYTTQNGTTTLQERMRIADNGTITGTYGTYHTSSDIRFKKDIATVENALEKVLALRGVNFRWKDPSKDQSLHMGMIAQEVEKVVPELVHTADDEMKTKAVEYQYIVALLVEATKELKAEKDAEITQLKTEIAALKAKPK